MGELNICKDCHQLITDEKFINKVYYMADDMRLVSVSGDKAKIGACMNCLNAYLEKNKKNSSIRSNFRIGTSTY